MDSQMSCRDRQGVLGFDAVAQFPFNYSGGSEAVSTYTVSDLQRLLRRDLERSFARIRVEGEISNLTIHHLSGHAYFTLKDANAQLRCVMWRDQVRRLKFRPENGQQVICSGKVTVYERGGTLQLSATRIELHGVGALQTAYRQLATKLREEGWTAPEAKQAIPENPKTIGIVTSRQAAALRDIMKTILRRNPQAHIIIAPTAVQGEAAAPKIADTLRQLDELEQADVIILSRGGGSIEDLWCFNEEVVARAIIDAKTPIVTGIGHETDTTIADLVSDHASSTPTAAAEETVPDQARVVRDWLQLESRLNRALQNHVERLRGRLFELTSQLKDPATLLHRRGQDFDELLQRAERALRDRIRNERARLAGLSEILLLSSPKTRHIEAQAELKHLIQRQDHAIHSQLAEAQLRLSRLAERLELLSPLSILSRGYAIAHTESGRAIRSSTDVKPGDSVRVRLHQGSLMTRVETLDP